MKQAIRKYLRYAKYALLAIAYMMLMEVVGWIFTSQGSWALQGGSTPFALIFYLVWTALFAALAVSLGFVAHKGAGNCSGAAFPKWGRLRALSVPLF